LKTNVYPPATAGGSDKGKSIYPLFVRFWTRSSVRAGPDRHSPTTSAQNPRAPQPWEGWFVNSNDAAQTRVVENLRANSIISIQAIAGLHAGVAFAQAALPASGHRCAVDGPDPNCCSAGVNRALRPGRRGNFFQGRVQLESRVIDQRSTYRRSRFQYELDQHRIGCRTFPSHRQMNVAVNNILVSDGRNFP